MAHLETHADPHYRHCQRAVVDFEIHNPNLTYIGRPLQLPGAGDAAVSVPGAPAYKTCHVTRRGETLTDIASLYNVPVQELRTAGGFFNRAAQLGCEPNGGSTQVRGTVGRNGQPISAYRVVFSWQPDGDVVARRVTGAGALRASTPTSFRAALPAKEAGGSGSKAMTATASQSAETRLTRGQQSSTPTAT